MFLDRSTGTAVVENREDDGQQDDVDQHEYGAKEVGFSSLPHWQLCNSLNFIRV